MPFLRSKYNDGQSKSIQIYKGRDMSLQKSQLLFLLSYYY